MQRILSGSLLIAGTTIGGGMLAIPLMTARMGFMPALVVMVAIWLAMYLSGLFVLQAILWIKQEVNFLTLAEVYLGKIGKIITGALYLFLYSCLLVAYFSGLNPLVNNLFRTFFTLSIPPVFITLLCALVFGFVVAFGMRIIDRVNGILFIALVFSFLALVLSSVGAIQGSFLQRSHWSSFFLSIPLLFTSFGFHNVLPSLTYYLKKDRRQIQLSILFGSLIALLFYIVWQVTILGVVDPLTLELFLDRSIPPSLALEKALHNPFVHSFTTFFQDIRLKNKK